MNLLVRLQPRADVNMMRLRTGFLMLLLVLSAVLCSGCPRDMEGAGYSAQRSTATYPWEPRGEQAGQAELQQQESPSEVNAQVAIPAGERWPALSGKDTLDEMTLAGNWLRVAFMEGERIRLLEPELVDHLQLRPDNSFTLSYPSNAPGGARRPIDGNWSKVGAGLIELAITGGDTLTLNAQQFRDDFLFFWSKEARQSFWYVRVQPSASQRLSRNRWKTSLGEMRIGNVIQDRFEFEVSGPSTRTGTGYYQDGILRLRWEDEQSSAGGYGAFIASPDLSQLKGVWWIDDYEAAPFGGAWDTSGSTPQA
jgi:hypothetical protein